MSRRRSPSGVVGTVEDKPPPGGGRRSGPGAADLIRSPSLAAAFGLGAGLSPVAPGTAGTVLAVPLWWLLSDVGAVAYLGLTGVAFIFGLWVCGRAQIRLDRHDHPGIVVDEIVGFMLALAAVPVSVPWVLGAFVLFRALDILKPWPIGWLDRRVAGALGVMLDDLAAGILTALVVLASRHWAPQMLGIG